MCVCVCVSACVPSKVNHLFFLCHIVDMIAYLFSHTLSLFIYLSLSLFSLPPSLSSPSFSLFIYLSLFLTLSFSFSQSLSPFPFDSLSLSQYISLFFFSIFPLSLSLSRMLTRKDHLLQATSLESCQTGPNTLHSGSIIAMIIIMMLSALSIGTCASTPNMICHILLTSITREDVCGIG